MLTLHLVVTSLCDRRCKYCCNNQYDVRNIPYVTDDDFEQCNMLCITGGEPFVYSNPCNLAKRYRKQFPNLKSVLVYTNAKELNDYLNGGGTIHDIDGLNISCKTKSDVKIFENSLSHHPQVIKLNMNRVYDFTGLLNDCPDGFGLIDREWQKVFQPAENCIFRRGN